MSQRNELIYVEICRCSLACGRSQRASLWLAVIKWYSRSTRYVRPSLFWVSSNGDHISHQPLFPLLMRIKRHIFPPKLIQILSLLNMSVMIYWCWDTTCDAPNSVRVTCGWRRILLRQDVCLGFKSASLDLCLLQTWTAFLTASRQLAAPQCPISTTYIQDWEQSKYIHSSTALLGYISEVNVLQ